MGVQKGMQTAAGIALGVGILMLSACSSQEPKPMAQPTPTRIMLMPMTAMMVPVTTGGKKRSILLMAGCVTLSNLAAPMALPVCMMALKISI